MLKKFNSKKDAIRYMYDSLKDEDCIDNERFAFLNNKTSIDFSVAGAQGFLNPILDIPYYYLNQITHPAFVGFIFGFLNGFLILLLYKIIEIVKRPFFIKMMIIEVFK